MERQHFKSSPSIGWLLIRSWNDVDLFAESQESIEYLLGYIYRAEMGLVWRYSQAEIHYSAEEYGQHIVYGEYGHRYTVAG